MVNRLFKTVVVLLLSVVFASGAWVVVYDSGAPVRNQVTQFKGPESPRKTSGKTNVFYYLTDKVPLDIATLRSNKVPMKFWRFNASGREVVEMNAAQKQAIRDAEAAKKSSAVTARNSAIRADATNRISIEFDPLSLAARAREAVLLEEINSLRAIHGAAGLTASNIQFRAVQKIVNKKVN